MKFDTDVLIVGGGPTGLMLACQLLRFGVSFRIIDKRDDRIQESRAFGIQAKSMEIFHNLGLASEFLKKAQIGNEASFYFRGKFRFKLSFKDIDVKDTPYPALFLLPQSNTEQILLDSLERQNVNIERQTELMSFTQTNDIIEANIRKELTGKSEKIRCRYLVGCDGAHSTVRHKLGIPFVGAAYEQEFILADVKVNWPFPTNNLTVFIGKEGTLLHLPLCSDLSRLIIFDRYGLHSPSKNQPTLEEIENFGKRITGKDFQLSNPIWISRFHLHHRAVHDYQKGHAFLAGDAAHIHSPIGAQGMNTGLQDATNLAWKIAFTLKYRVPQELLATYQTERQRVGQVLVKTTDRIFGAVISKNSIITAIRQYVVPIVMRFLVKSRCMRNRVFGFISELNIHYHENPFIIENINGADTKFLCGPQAGRRAPDAPLGHSTLFDLFREKPCNILLFYTEEQCDKTYKNKIRTLEKISPQMLAIHKFIQPQELPILYERYGITKSGAYFIRPDGYIGFRSFGSELEPLQNYLHKLFGIKP